MNKPPFTWTQAYSGVEGSDYRREYHGCTLLRDIGDDERCRSGCEIAMICVRHDGVMHGFDDANAHILTTTISAAVLGKK